MDHVARFLRHRRDEELLWLRLNVDPQATDDDAMAYLQNQCGRQDQRCRFAQSDYCERDCPFRPEDL